MSFVHRVPRPVLVSLGAASVLGLAACGSSSEASTGEAEVASLVDDTDQPSEGAAEDVALDPGEAALAFSACLRDEGIDVPDIGVDANGEIALRDALQSIERDETLRDAMQSCVSLLEGTGFGGGRARLADDVEFQDALLEFSDCVRSEGFPEIGDLTIPSPGEGGAPDATPGDDAEGAERGQGQRPAGFGDRSASIAERLGLDPDDPDVMAAIDACLPIIDTALADAGVGPAAD